MNYPEQFFIQQYNSPKKLVAEQYPGDHNPLSELIKMFN